jgi:hypothetical protein
MRFEVFTTVSIHVEIFWVLEPFSVVVGYQRFGESCCLHLHNEDAGSVFQCDEHVTKYKTISVLALLQYILCAVNLT